MHWWTNVEWWCFFLTSSLPPRLLNCSPKVLSWMVALHCIAVCRAACCVLAGWWCNEGGNRIQFYYYYLPGQSARGARQETRDCKRARFANASKLMMTTMMICLQYLMAGEHAMEFINIVFYVLQCSVAFSGYIGKYIINMFLIKIIICSRTFYLFLCNLHKQF